MKKCCFCCISLQKGVVAIGVLSMIVSVVLAVGYGVVAVTLEERVVACRSGEPKDILGILPACEALAEAGTLLAARIFVYAQVGVWMLYLLFSILLIVGAVKERTGLLVPWLVLSVVVMAAVVWAGVRAALHHHTLDLLASVVSVAVVAYFCLVVRAYSRHVKRTGLVPVPVHSTFHHPRQPHSCCRDDLADEEPTSNGQVVGRSPARSPRGLNLPRVLPRELPPAYSPRDSTPTKKGPPPTGLGIRI